MHACAVRCAIGPVESSRVGAVRGIISWVVALFVVAVALAIVIASAGLPASAAILLAADLTLAIIHALWGRIRDAVSSPRHWRQVDQDTYETDIDGARCRASFHASNGRAWVIEVLSPEKNDREREALTRRAIADWHRQPMARRPGDGLAGPLGQALLRRIRLVMVGATAVILCVLAVLFAGPLFSGALFLVLPGPARAHLDSRTPSPLHRGHIDLGTGLYIREDDDLLLDGRPPIAVRRKYLSRYHVSLQFGVGATHDGEWYLIGDGQQFRWAALILADGERIEFGRTTGGSSLWNAMYQHRSSPSEFRGARLGWVGFGWAMRLDDGSLEVFRPCGPATNDVCSRVRSRDAEGRSTYFRRDGAGRLLRIESSGQWIAFDYDQRNRIKRAYDSFRREVRYGYDDGGRLASAEASDGAMRLYRYTDRDEMQRISEPGRTVENVYDAEGRVIRQTTWTTGQPDPYVLAVSYRVENRSVIEAEVNESDGSWRHLTFRQGYSISESYRAGDSPLTTFDYRRDVTTNVITEITVACTDRRGRQVTRSSLVTTGDVEWIKRDLVQMGCAFSSWEVPR